MPKRKICIVTGSRADYGLLYWLIHDLLVNPAFEVQLVVTGMHLSPEFGLTYKAIEADGLAIDARVEMLLSSDSALGVTKAVGLGVLSFSEVFERLNPDLVMVLGDRFEIFAAVQAAMFARLPIGHIGGGDVTEGAFDEAIRHSITKMAHLHFVTNADAARRVRQLGENPSHIFHVGSPGLDYLHRSKLLDRATLEQELDFKFRDRNFLITFHPETLDPEPSELQMDALLGALDEMDSSNGLIITMPNADTCGRVLIRRIQDFVARKENAKAFVSLGQARYLGTMAIVDAVIGNSSSGLYEAPSLHTPTVNIGQRQKGRLRAASVFDCRPERLEITTTIKDALRFGRRQVENPYQLGDCVQLIIKALENIDNFPSLVMKHFVDRPDPC
ncbi:MAG: UDP-N-acetylglucosamine 2-epimerase [Acidiferrobacteraceae bacterium]